MDICKICNQFKVNGAFLGYNEIKVGNINTTYVVDYLENSVTVKYVLQKINKYVFTNPESVMQNVVSIVSHILSNDKNYPLKCIEAKPNGFFVLDENHDYWRMYNFITNSISYECASELNIAYETGFAFGKFQAQLSTFDATKLNETIKDFHNTKLRIKRLEQASKDDKFNRKVYAKTEIDYILERKNSASILCNLLDDNKLPLRVTHNDTKCNNVLFDKANKKAIVVVDLDTVMPGLCAYDYGDGIRSIASTVVEDEENLDLVDFNFDKFKAFTKGFLSQVKYQLTSTELSTLYLGIETITLELATRFLTDFLQGDLYFKTEYPTHNLVRAKNQIALYKKIMLNRERIIEYIATI